VKYASVTREKGSMTQPSQHQGNRKKRVPGKLHKITPLSHPGQPLLRGWTKQYGRPLALREVQEINRNLSRFFSLMSSWEQHFKEKGLLK